MRSAPFNLDVAEAKPGNFRDLLAAAARQPEDRAVAPSLAPLGTPSHQLAQVRSEFAPRENPDRIDIPASVSHCASFCHIEDTWRRGTRAVRRSWVMDVGGCWKAKNRSSWYELGRCF